MAKHPGPNLAAPRTWYLILGVLFERYVRLRRKSTGQYEKGRIFELNTTTLTMNHANPVVIPFEDIDEIRSHKVVIRFDGPELSE